MNVSLPVDFSDPGTAVDNTDRHLSLDKRMFLAADPESPPGLLEQLSLDALSEVRNAVSLNPQTPDDVMYRMAVEDIVRVKLSLVSNQNVPDSVLDVLMQDDDPAVRAAAAEHPDLPEEALWQAIHDEDIGVRCSAAGNVSVTEAMQKELARDHDAAVKEALAHQSDLLPEVVDMLTLPMHVSVAVALAQSESLTETAAWAIWQVGGGGCWRVLSANPLTPPEILERLAETGDAQVRLRAAANSALPPQSLTRLIADSDFRVRQSAAANVNLPASAATTLRNDAPSVRCGLARNPSAPAKELIDMLSDHEHADVRLNAARNESVPLEEIHSALDSADSDPDMFLALLSNPGLSLASLAQAAEHSDADILDDSRQLLRARLMAAAYRD